MTGTMRGGAGVALALLVAGCATVSTPTVTDVSGRRPWAARIERPLFRDAVLTMTDPMTGEAFRGKLPGTAPKATISTGNAQPAPRANNGTAFALLVGDRGGALTCQIALESWSGSGVCSDTAGRSIYLAF